MQRYEINSSAIRTVTYDEASGTMEVYFHKWGSYRYFDVPEFVIRALLKAPSKGEYFNRCIADRYKSEEIR